MKGHWPFFLFLQFLCIWLPLVAAMRPLLPTPTFAGLRAAEVDLGMIPTPTPWSQAELFKRLSRLSGDPGICGWVEGNQNNTVSCNSGYTCAATSTYVGCCSTGAVGCQALFTTCYGKGGPSCSGACLLNTAALLCEGKAPYCATYQYDQGSRGYGCAPVTGYNKTVLTTTNPGFTPFGQITSSSSSSTSEATAALASPAPSPSPSSTNLTLISGGAIAGAVAGSVLVLAVIVGIVYLIWRRHSRKKEQERQAATIMSERRESQFVYAQYAKPDASTLSPPTSPPMHSRQPSDQGYGFATSPPLSDNGQPWSPGGVNSWDKPAELAAGDEDTHPAKR